MVSKNAMAPRESMFNVALALCSSCNELLVGEIYQCQKYHALCEKCKTSSKCACPTGKADYKRSHLLEKLIGSFYTRCVNHPEGCTDKLPISKKRSHEAMCKYSHFKCVFCPMDLRLEGYARHLQTSHQMNLIEVTDCDTWFGTRIETPTVKAVKVGRELFLLHCVRSNWNVDWNVMFVTAVGSSKMANAYSYELSAFKKNARFTIASSPASLAHAGSLKSEVLVVSPDPTGAFMLEVCIKRRKI